MAMIATGALPYVVGQHCAESANLRNLRQTLVTAPDVTLPVLRRFDDRLAAHLDALVVAGELAWQSCEAALEVPSVGVVFTVAVRAIEDRQQRRLDRLFALNQAVVGIVDGLTSAFGWLEQEQLQGVVASLLASQEPLRRVVGIAACAMHRVDPGLVSARRIQDSSLDVRSRALRAAGEIGRYELVSTCAAGIADEEPHCQFWAAWSAVLLGDRNMALEALTSAGLTPGVHMARAFPLALQAKSVGAAHAVLQGLAKESDHYRWLMQGSGIVGDPTYVPWLIKQMADDKTARLAGEAFSLITGADLALLDLERKPPEDFKAGPNDDPDDPHVEMDPDDGLPWPDVERIQRWWSANGPRFQAGTRYFMGAPVTREHCIDVLKNGYQRQRVLAAHYLCLLEPGTPLFNTSAPAWRQQKLLAQMA